MQNKMLTASELAELLQMSIDTIYHWVGNKEVPYYKIGRGVRFDLDEINAWIKERKNGKYKGGKK